MWDQQRQQEGGADIDCERQCIIGEIPSSESSASVVLSVLNIAVQQVQFGL